MNHHDSSGEPFISEAVLREFREKSVEIEDLEAKLKTLKDARGVLARRNRVKSLFWWDDQYQKLREGQGTLKSYNVYPRGLDVRYEVAIRHYDEGELDYQEVIIGHNAWYTLKEACVGMEVELRRRAQAEQDRATDNIRTLQDHAQKERLW